MRKRRNKQKLKFIYTFLFFLCVLVMSVLFNINNNLPTFDKAIVTGAKKDSIPEGVIEVVDADTLKSSQDESVVTLAGNSIKATNSTNIDKNKQYTIVIDPGHGGPDPGAIGSKGTLEKNVALSVALKVGPILEKQGYKIIYTRKTDKIAWSGQREELLERAQISNNAKADLYISIHTNSSEIKSVRGVETYYNRVSSKGRKLAQLVQREIIKEVNLQSRGIKTENYSVLKNVNAPSILVELGYISNTTEESILRSPQYQNKFAQGIADGVVTYLKNNK